MFDVVFYYLKISVVDRNEHFHFNEHPRFNERLTND